MGNHQSSEQQQHQQHDDIRHAPPKLASTSESGERIKMMMDDDKSKFKSFPGSAILEKTFCGSIDTTDPSEYQNENLATRLLRKADMMCVSSPIGSRKDASFYSSDDDDDDDDDDWSRDSNESDNDENNSLTAGSPRRRRRRSSSGTPQKLSARLLARALVSEVTDNPKTMKPAEMAAREKKLLRAQEAAAKSNDKAVGAPGVGVGPPRVLKSLAYACTGGNESTSVDCLHPKETSNNPAAALLASTGEALGMSPAEPLSLSGLDLEEAVHLENPFAVTIAVCMSHRSPCGHPETVTRQTAFDLNLVQDRAYKYVATTDKKGWRAGGGEPGGGPVVNSSNVMNKTDTSPAPLSPTTPSNMSSTKALGGLQTPRNESLAEKEANMDCVHIPILHINCKNKHAVDQVIHALASGDIFIPHMSVLPDSLSSVQDNKTLPDLCLRFDCDRNDEDTPPEEWTNWCLEFMHNQLYEYFCRNPTTSPVWMPRPFNLTLARGVRWKTVKHMNRYFCHGEQVLAQWKEQGPQYLDPLPAYMDGGACPEEVARPHGIYLLRKDLVSGKIIPTNYFAPNFEPPYTTKMTRSLLENVLGKSWDTKRQEWTSQPQARLLSPGALFAAACGCSEGAGGFVAKEVTVSNNTKAVDPSMLPSQRTPPMASAVAVVARDSPQDIAPESPSQPAVHLQGEVDSEEDEEDPFAETLKQNSQDLVAEEKKTEEQEPPTNAINSATGMSRFTLMQQQQQQQDSERPISVAASGFVSVGTTVVAANISASKKLQKDHSNQLFSDEDWLQSERAERDSQVKNVHSDPPGNKVSPMWTEKKKKKLTQTSKDKRPPQTESARREKKASTHYKMQPVLTSEKRLSPSFDDHKDNESGFSLEYSLDGSSAIYTANDNSTLLGQTYTAEADSMSISSFGQRQQLPPYSGSKTAAADTTMTSERVNEAKKGEQRAAPEKTQIAEQNKVLEDNIDLESSAVDDSDGRESTVADEDDDDEGESLLSVVPTDAELFAVGWAKALDASSGNYYYFTLDRTKTVWDNPLADEQERDDEIKRPVDP